MVNKILPFLLVVGCVVVAPAAARADAEPTDCDPTYHSSFRRTWADEVRKDCALRTDIRDALKIAVHREQSDKFTRNNRHVVLAYGAIWVLTLGFVVMMWRRQARLTAEIDRLRAEVARLTRDDGGGA
jgi:CcmD family protein